MTLPASGAKVPNVALLGPTAKSRAKAVRRPPWLSSRVLRSPETARHTTVIPPLPG
jgi:hypothetical protein